MTLRRSALLAMVAAASAALLTACGGGSDEPTFGSIAVSASAGQAAMAWNADSQAEADRLARAECGSADCQVVLQFGQCGAFSADGNLGIWGAASGGSAAAAQSAAQAQCQAKGGQNCAVVAALPARCN